MYLLRRLVAQFDEQQEPVTIRSLVTETDLDRDRVLQCVRIFEDCHLIEPVSADGYRPTVTARELLALELGDDEFIVIEEGPERGEEPR